MNRDDETIALIVTGVAVAVLWFLFLVLPGLVMT